MMSGASLVRRSPGGAFVDYERKMCVVSPENKEPLDPENDVEQELQEGEIRRRGGVLQSQRQREEESNLFRVARKAAAIFEVTGILPNESVCVTFTLILGIAFTLGFAARFVVSWYIGKRESLREESLRELVQHYLETEGVNEEVDGYLKTIGVLRQCRDKVDQLLEFERGDQPRKDLVALRHGLIVEKTRLFALYRKELSRALKSGRLERAQFDIRCAEVSLASGNRDKDRDGFNSQSYSGSG